MRLNLKWLKKLSRWRVLGQWVWWFFGQFEAAIYSLGNKELGLIDCEVPIFSKMGIQKVIHQRHCNQRMRSICADEIQHLCCLLLKQSLFSWNILQTRNLDFNDTLIKWAIEKLQRKCIEPLAVLEVKLICQKFILKLCLRELLVLSLQRNTSLFSI